MMLQSGFAVKLQVKKKKNHPAYCWREGFHFIFWVNVSFKHSSSLHSVTANVYRLQILLISPKKESYWSITAYYLLKMYSCKLHADHEAPNSQNIMFTTVDILCVCGFAWVCVR